MERHWSRTALDLLSSVLTIASISHLWRQTSDESSTLSPRWLLAGVTSTVCSRVLYDRDALRIRNRKRRRFTYYGIHALVARRLLPDDDVANYNIAIGSALGTIAYVVWNDVFSQLLE